MIEPFSPHFSARASPPFQIDKDRGFPFSLGKGRGIGRGICVLSVLGEVGQGDILADMRRQHRALRKKGG